ncbi:MAG: bifunctional methylenetetrahydrofolate dehydrogenase/methenyltetrahydrofolate cyclohydrolase [Elusimicrobia bacterium RIFOXYA2_FULL_50_26]|nr:MAG: bifunctional methylenetetrahydrofolate dehydrogenase/methenyltetrahydrofolate cyclohydrolase [Elusimicrobia bacterium RIFOXYA2_FULL_50_26]
MSAEIIDGKKLSAQVREQLKRDAAALKSKGVEPGLATILVGDDPASRVYVSSKIKACAEIGIRSFHFPLPANSTEEEIIACISRCNSDTRIHGILLQLPLPAGLSSDRCLEAINPAKDVDGLHPYNIGRMASAKSWKDMLDQKLLLPCTPHGVIMMLERMNIPISGKNAVVVGRSNLGGKPVAIMLLANNATVTIAHSKTRDLAGLCRTADILVGVIGKSRFITREFVKPGAAVIDVGINRTPEGICGDVDFDGVKEVAGFITPVPGGVGATTITMLMQNTILAASHE